MKRGWFILALLSLMPQAAHPQRPPALIHLKDYQEDLRIISSEGDVLLGSSLATGDLNNDGFDDLIMGAYGASGPDGLEVGNAYIVFGGPRLFRAFSINRPGPGRTIIYGDDRYDSTGEEVACADLNNDGFDDAIIGAPQIWKGGPGHVYIIYGREEWPREIDLNTNGAPIPGLTRVRGIRKPGTLGFSLATGDVNGDGIDDLVMGDYAGGPRGSNAGREGEVYVIYGSNTLPANDIIEMSQPSVPFLKVQGVAGEQAQIGGFTGCFDVDEDGYHDLLIGSISQARDGTVWLTGRVYVVHGTAVMPELVDLDSVTVPAARITQIIGEQTYDYFGSAFAAGDVNGDGRQDLVVGTRQYIRDHRWDAGKLYVIFGPFPDLPVIDLRTFTGKTVMVGPDTLGSFGAWVACGDIDGDGLDDVIAGAEYATVRKNMEGKAWAIYGRPRFPQTLDLKDEARRAATQILGYQEYQTLGRPVETGDLDGDSIDDFIASATQTVTASGSLSGEVYVVYGRAYDAAPSPVDIPHLNPNHPNPFNGYTTIPYQLDAPTYVSMRIYSALGQEVRKLVDGPVEAGFHSAVWDGLDNHLFPVGSGVYFVRLQTSRFVEVRKMLYVR